MSLSGLDAEWGPPPSFLREALGIAAQSCLITPQTPVSRSGEARAPSAPGGRWCDQGGNWALPCPPAGQEEARGGLPCLLSPFSVSLLLHHLYPEVLQKLSLRASFPNWKGIAGFGLQASAPRCPSWLPPALPRHPLLLTCKSPRQAGRKLSPDCLSRARPAEEALYLGSAA